MTAELVVIGGGKMGEALVGGLLTSGWAKPTQVVVVEALAERREALCAPDGLASRHPGLAILDAEGALARGGAAGGGAAGGGAAGGGAAGGGAAGGGGGALIAVKPGDVASACALAVRLGVGRVLSIAAGVTIDSLTTWLGGAAGGGSAPSSAGAPVVLRAMPNTPALIGAGAAGLAGGPGATEGDLSWAEGILSAVGVVVRVTEPALDAITGLSGSGPAYVFLVAEALVDAGVFVGLPRPTASRLAIQTLLGAARMLDETGESAETLRAAVTSPGGTTASGLRALETAAVRAAFVDAVVAATERSRELGQG